jgi:hypothetical protein
MADFRGNLKQNPGEQQFLSKLRIKKIPGANFYELQAYEITQSHGLRFFNFSPFLLASARIFILKQITPPVRGGKVIFLFYAEICFF